MRTSVLERSLARHLGAKARRGRFLRSIEVVRIVSNPRFFSFLSRAHRTLVSSGDAWLTHVTATQR